MDRDIAGIILAGGLSRRMGGGDKSLLALGGGPRARPCRCHALRPQVGPLALSANGDPARFAAVGLPVLADTVEGFAGPLAGILTGLEWAAANTACKAIVTAAGDTPFLPAGSGRAAGRSSRQTSRLDRRRLFRRQAASDLRAVAARMLREALRHFLVDEDNRRVSAFIDRHDFVEVEFPMLKSGGASDRPVLQHQHADDLAEAERLLQSMRP